MAKGGTGGTIGEERWTVENLKCQPTTLSAILSAIVYIHLTYVPDKLAESDNPYIQFSSIESSQLDKAKIKTSPTPYHRVGKSRNLLGRLVFARPCQRSGERGSHCRYLADRWLAKCLRIHRYRLRCPTASDACRIRNISHPSCSYHRTPNRVLVSAGRAEQCFEAFCEIGAARRQTVTKSSSVEKSRMRR